MCGTIFFSECSLLYRNKKKRKDSGERRKGKIEIGGEEGGEWSVRGFRLSRLRAERV